MKAGRASGRRRSAVMRAIAVLRVEGLASFWFKLVGELGFRRLLVQERLLAQPVPDVSPGLPVRIELLKDSALDEYFAFRPEAAHNDISNRLQSGSLCFVARHEGRVVSTCWTTRSRARTEYLGSEIAMAVGDVYLFDAFTAVAYRGNNVAHALCMTQLRYFQQAGYRRAIRATLPENRSALRAHAKSGFQPTRVIGRLKIGPWERAFERPWQGKLR